MGGAAPSTAHRQHDTNAAPVPDATTESATSLDQLFAVDSHACAEVERPHAPSNTRARENTDASTSLFEATGSNKERPLPNSLFGVNSSTNASPSVGRSRRKKSKRRRAASSSNTTTAVTNAASQSLRSLASTTDPSSSSWPSRTSNKQSVDDSECASLDVYFSPSRSTAGPNLPSSASHYVGSGSIEATTPMRSISCRPFSASSSGIQASWLGDDDDEVKAADMVR